MYDNGTRTVYIYLFLCLVNLPELLLIGHCDSLHLRITVCKDSGLHNSVAFKLKTCIFFSNVGGYDNFFLIKNVFGFSKQHFWRKNYTLCFAHFFSILTTVVGERVGKSSAICIDFASQVFLFTPPNLFSLCLPSFLSIHDRLYEKQGRLKTLLTILRHLHYPIKMRCGH